MLGLFGKKEDSELIDDAKQKFIANLIDYLGWTRDQSKQYKTIVEKTLDNVVDSFSVQKGQVFADIGYTGTNFEKADDCMQQTLQDFSPKQIKEFQSVSLYTISYLETVCNVHVNDFTKKITGRHALDSWDDLFQNSWNFYKSWQTLLETETMAHIENFAEKFLYYEITETDFKQLHSFLTFKGVDLTLSMLKKFVEQIQFSLKADRLNVWIEAKKPKVLTDYVDSFVEFFGDKTFDNLKVFESLLKRKNISYDGNLNDLLSRRDKEIEMELYVQSLKEPYSPNPYSIDAVDSMSEDEFKDFLKHLFEKMGFTVELTVDNDILISKPGQKTIVKAKKSITPIPKKAVQEITEAINNYNAYDGMVVSSNNFPPSEIKVAHSNGIELINRSKLNSWIKTYLSE